MKKLKFKLKPASPYLLVLLSFLGAILLGSLLLTFPFTHKDGQWGNYIDSLFISTSATCVTGLSTYKEGIGNELNLGGQIVVAVLISIGGLGFITIFTFFVTIFQRKLQFKDRLFLSHAISSNTIAGISKYVRQVILIVIVTVLLGFLLGLPVFLQIKDYTIGEAIWGSLFTSISAFNNAGFDIFGAYSLVNVAENVIINSLPTWAYYYLCSYIMFLIIIGGISFITIIDVVILRQKPRQWNGFVKIVLLTTGILLVSGFIIFIFTDVIPGDMNTFQAAFQSVTLRTAGFANYDQASLSPAGKSFSCLFMLIGGSPISTAGGIKTTTIFIIVLCLVRFLQGKKIVAFKREYTRASILKAMVVVFLSIATIMLGYIIMCSLEQNNSYELATKSENIMFEAFSAFGTVGLSTGITPYLSIGSKIVLIILMFFGRLGPITLFQVFLSNVENEEIEHFKRVKTDVIIG